MKAWVWKRVSFEAAHSLEGYPGNCHRLHGHTYSVELGVEGVINPDTGMVIDLQDLGEFLFTNVLALYDHHNLNEKFKEPSTAENIAKHIWSAAWRYFSETFMATDVIVRVFETPDSWVELRKPEVPTQIHSQEVK